MMNDTKRNYTLLSAYLFCYFFAQGATISLLSIWYRKSLGLTGAEVGMVFAANFAVALISQPIYGYVSDKLGLRKHILWTVCLLCLSCGLFFNFVYAPLLREHVVLGAVVGGLYLGVTFVAGSYAIESYVDRVGRKYGFEYGRARMWGSLGYASAAFFSGHIYNFNPNANFLLASVAGVILLPVLLASKIEVNQAEQQSIDSLNMRHAFAVLKMKKFWSFMVLILGVTDLYLVFDQQFPIYFASLFATPEVGNTMFGYLTSAQIFLEAGMMFIAPVIVRRIGPKAGLLLAASVMIVRITGSGLATGPVTISCMKMLHAAELPILVVSVFKYIALHFESRLSSTIYMVGFSFGHSLGLAVLSPIVGKLYDLLGFRITYLLLAGFALIFLVWSFFVLAPTPKPLDAGSVHNARLSTDAAPSA